jgi:hypothetical protein
MKKFLSNFPTRNEKFVNQLKRKNSKKFKEGDNKLK